MSTSSTSGSMVHTRTIVAISALSLSAITAGLLLWKLNTRNVSTKAKAIKAVNLGEQSSPSSNNRKLHILYATTRGAAKRYAEELKRRWNRACKAENTNIYDLSTYEPEKLWTLAEGKKAANTTVVIIMSTANGGEPPESGRAFMDWLRDISTDFRRNKAVFSTLAGVAVFGLGSSAYDDDYFCTAAKECASLLKSLGGNPYSHYEIDFPGIGDDTATNEDEVFTTWCNTLIAAAAGRKKNPSLGKKKVETRSVGKKKSKYQPEPEETEEDRLNDYFVDAEVVGNASEVLDIEDMGAVIGQQIEEAKSKGGPKEMVTPRQRASLKKEGYKIIGTHSAVKLCRWTKNQLRGRGGCYKHTCYGITSYQCMEATPSLACANKCTFCWRHHKNPVGTSWRWKIDEPADIVQQAIELHDQMVKQMKGVPGVKPERLAEARRVRHCALSLVGEPIMYPRINELLDELHSREISTFLVTNAQFPECIESLSPVTQLYVSIDAATKDSLKKVDRPLFKDFWERFQQSLISLKNKRQRTVYRLTLLKGENMDDIEEYASLVKLGQPDFIEVKSVTYCGKSDASDLTFDNVPFHEEVVAFCQEMCDKVNKRVQDMKNEPMKTLGDEYSDSDFPEYEICSEHQHSNLVLIAKKTYKIEDKWHTWIDYDKYYQCWLAWKESNGVKTFTSMDYLAPTPSWACYGAKERGMDPLETRVYHNRTVQRAKEGKLSEMQLRQYPTNPALQ